MNARLLLIGIIVLAGILRLWGIDKYPAGFTPDEASFGYDAYSILKTGKDGWGESFPLSFRSFGDFKSPLYTYLTVPSVGVFGLNEFAVRLPNAILGVLAVLVVYLLVIELFKDTKSAINHKSLAIVASFLLAVSPWHISLSRGAFEANLTTLLMPLGIFALLRGGRWTLVSAFIFGLNLFSYHSAKLVTSILVLFLIWWKRREVVRNALIYASGVIFLLFAGLAFLSAFMGSGTRASDIGIFNPTGGWGVVAERRYDAVQTGLPDEVARVFSNKVTYTLSEFTKNYLSYFSPTFLFTQGAGEATYGMLPGHGVLYLFELPFVVMGLWYVVRLPAQARGGLKLSNPMVFVLVWILLSPIPAALTKGPGFAANRAAVMMPALQVLSAYGAITLFGLWKKHIRRPLRDIGILGYWVIGVLGILFFLEAYFYHAPRSNAPSMSYGWEGAMSYIQSVKSDYKEVVISRAFSEPHIFVAFHTKWDPVDYQKQAQDFLRYEKQGLLFVDQLGEYSLGNFTFRDIHYQEKDSGLADTLLVGRARDFPENIEAKFRVFYPDGKPAIVVVSNEKSK